MLASLSKTASILLLILTALFVYGKFGPGLPISSVVTQQQEFLTVSGEGKVTVVPDMGVVDLGIQVNRPTVKLAQTEANTIINTISQALKNLGVADKDIKTSSYSVYPQYDFTSGTGRITSYQVAINLTITVRQLDQLNQVIDQSTSAGANTVSNIQLTVDETRRKQLYQQARSAAVDQAKATALSLSQAAGISLGKIVNIQETGPSSSPRPYLLRSADVALGGGGTEIQPGSTDITSTITLYYETR